MLNSNSSFCIACATSFCQECVNPNLELRVCCCGGINNAHMEDIRDSRSGSVKANEDVSDPGSTGRKRAAILYPITEGLACEWTSLKLAGGGKFPIVGCPGRIASNRHHGPDKNTLNNEPGNVHRICEHCHNRWHSRNDPVFEEYFGNSNWLSHDPITQASADEVLSSEVYWNTLPADRKRKVE